MFDLGVWPRPHSAQTMVASFRGRAPVAEELGAGTYARGALRTRPVRLVRLSEGRTAPAPVEAISGEKEINEGEKKKKVVFRREEAKLYSNVGIRDK